MKIQSLQKMSGDEPFTDTAICFKVQEFWAFALSDLITNMNRGHLAEFLVAKALGVADAQNEFISDATPWDLDFEEKRIEVKSSSFCQRWQGDNYPSHSQPGFDIRKKHRTEDRDRHPKPPTERHSDIIVFALFAKEGDLKPNPLALNNWRFFVVPTKAVNEQMQEKQRISLTQLQNEDFQKKLQVFECTFDGLRKKVREIAAKL